MDNISEVYTRYGYHGVTATKWIFRMLKMQDFMCTGHSCR